MKKLISLILVLVMLTGLLAGCGSSSDSAEETAEEETTVEETVEEAAEEETEEAEEPEETAEEETEEQNEEETAEESEEAAAETAEEEAETTGVTYPLTEEEITMTIWVQYMSTLSGYMDSYNDHILNDAVAEATGIRLEWTDAPESTASENFNLIVVSGDYMDFMPVYSYYTGGCEKALEDGVIIDLTDYLDEWGPDYKAAVQAAGDTWKDLSDDNGRILTFATIQDEYLPISGPQLRQDWLDELGMEAATTPDELYDLLVAVQTAHPECSRPFYVDQEGIMYGVYSAFDTLPLSLSNGVASKLGYAFAAYQRDGVIYSGLQDDGYREYLEFFNKIFEAGLTDQDFYSTTESGSDMQSLRGSGDMFMWYGNSDDFSVTEDLSSDPDINIVAVAAMAPEGEDHDPYGEYQSYIGMQYASVTTTCEYPEYAVAFINYFYTEEGQILGNYGIEGLSFEYDEDGNPAYNDLVLDNPDGMGTNVAMMYYSFSSLPTYNIRGRSFSAYLQKEIDAMYLWAETSTGENMLPGLTFTTEESTEYANVSSDLYTYAAETVLKFMTGAEEINDETWQEFQDTLVEMGIDRCIEIYQDALDRYNAR